MQGLIEHMTLPQSSVESEARSAQLSKAPRRVLVISYTFPPVGGAGVQRITKFIKYLPRHGWLPTVLTVSNPSVPVLDGSLADDIPAGVEVVRAKSWEPGYGLKKSFASASTPSRSPLAFGKRLVMQGLRSAAQTLLQPDSQILWYHNAVAAGKRILNAAAYDAIFVTAPPFSAFLIGTALARAAKLPLLIDYRDEWTISNEYLENKKLGRIASAFQTRMENRVLRAATSIIATTQASAKSIEQRCKQAAANAPVSCIYNGFDPEDFLQLPAVPRDRSRLQIVYTGTLWHLTNVSPLVQAISRLSAARPELAEQLEVVLVGRKVGHQLEHIARLRQTKCRVIERDYLDHKEALGLLRSADVACLLLSDVPGAERVVPAKLFEYAASQRQVLAILPRGEAWDLLGRVPRVAKFTPQDVPSITDWLESTIVNRPQVVDETDLNVCDGFDRDSQTRQLADTLEGIVSSRHS